MVIEETHERQIEDVKTLEGFKKWAKENAVGVSALLVSIAGLVTTVLLAGRTALAKGAMSALKAGANASKKAVEYAAKAAKNAFGTLISALPSIALSLIGFLLKTAGKGLAWLSTNLWALLLVMVLYALERFRGRRIKKTKT